jgi:hypothetical protein
MQWGVVSGRAPRSQIRSVRRIPVLAEAKLRLDARDANPMTITLEVDFDFRSGASPRALVLSHFRD